MKKNILFLAFIVLQISVFSQWQQVYTNNTWANGTVLYSHKNILFQIGFANTSYQTLRSGDNGTSWTDITSSFPDDHVYHMLSFGNTVFALTDSLGEPNDYFIYASTDDGVTWFEKSRIDRGANNGAILSMASDGTNLYAVSNRRSIYKSTDEGVTWSEIIINYTGTSSILSFAVSGNTYLAALLGDGAVLSTDGGATWSLKNSTAPITFLYKLNNDIWGVGSSFSGIFKFNTTTNSWENNYSPSSFSLPISIGANSTNLISTFGDFLTNNRKYYSSSDNGISWSELTTDTIGLTNNILSSYAVTANSSYYFAAYWKFANSVITASVYRLPITVTSVEGDNILPQSYFLSQNYPNPFNPNTNINFSIPNSSFVTLKVYDVLGKEVANLVNEELSAGTYNFNFDAAKLTSGIYFYRIQTDNFVDTKKMILLK